MDKARFYRLEDTRKLELVQYLRSKGYAYNGWLIVEDDTATSVGILDNSHIKNSDGQPTVVLKTSNSDLEKVLDEFIGRDSNPSDLPLTSSSDA